VAADSGLWQHDPAAMVWDRFEPPEPPSNGRLGTISDLAFDPEGNPWPLYDVCGGANCNLTKVRFRWQDGTWVQIREEIVLSQLFFDNAGTPWNFVPGMGVFLNQTDPAAYAPVSGIDVDAVGRIWAVSRADGGELSLWIIP